MSPLPIVEELEVLEQFRARRGACGPRGVVNELDLEGRKEALGDSIVPAIAPAAHAADDPVLREDLPVVGTGVLGEFHLSVNAQRREVPKRNSSGLQVVAGPRRLGDHAESQRRPWMQGTS